VSTKKNFKARRRRGEEARLLLVVPRQVGEGPSLCTFMGKEGGGAVGETGGSTTGRHGGEKGKALTDQKGGRRRGGVFVFPISNKARGREQHTEEENRETRGGEGGKNEQRKELTQCAGLEKESLIAAGANERRKGV